MNNTAEILDRGMQCLVGGLGSIDAEKFLSTLMREKFDYTVWQRTYFDNMQPGEFHGNAVEYAKSHANW